MLRRRFLWGREDITWDVGERLSHGIAVIQAVFSSFSGKCFQNLPGPFLPVPSLFFHSPVGMVPPTPPHGPR